MTFNTPEDAGWSQLIRWWRLIEVSVRVVFCAAVLFSFTALAQSVRQGDEIRILLKNAEGTWNRGDLAAFVSDYEDSPDTTFVGREVTRGGPRAILERYTRTYPTRDAMGTLTFSEIEVRTLAVDVALANGKYFLKRTVAAGGDASGRFTLILRRTAAGWKIIHDHSSSSAQ